MWDTTEKRVKFDNRLVYWSKLRAEVVEIQENQKNFSSLDHVL